jgi:hypothetical protein
VPPEPSASPSDAPPVVRGVHPTPSEEEAVAIAAALEVGWPRLVVASAPDDVQEPRWRFSGRWWSRPVPQRRARP